MSSAACLNVEVGSLGIADRASNALIGDIGLCVSSGEEEAEIGFTLCAQAQGLGLATEAVSEAIDLLFEHTAIARVVSITDVRNLPSVRLLERVHMKNRDCELHVSWEAVCGAYVRSLTAGERSGIDVAKGSGDGSDSAGCATRLSRWISSAHRGAI
jgi:hypothetical protein